MKQTTLKIASIMILALSFMSFTILNDVKVDVSKSEVIWKGYKVTGQHEGTITLKEGTLMFDGETLTGGNFVMDMTSINTTDLEGDYKAKLDGHLKSADFFGVEAHPEAVLEFIKVNGSGKTYYVTANLTIKGKTNEVKFPLLMTENGASAELKIDRSKYDVRYGSTSFFDNLKDKAIYDEFDLNVNLVF
ncbi:MAG: YceI family protein [Winogradskyella sp.]|nr:YceI family protein [Winogradskyella sp.]NNK40156.1 YceI family protein [Winogradskyella sp.]